MPRTGGSGGVRNRQLLVAVVVIGLGLGIVAAALVVQGQVSRGQHAPAAPAAPLTLSADAAAERQAWIVGPLLGRDNGDAPMTTTRISGSAPHKVNIPGDVDFTCSVDFGQDGRPSRLYACATPGRSSPYRFASSSIALRCVKHTSFETCYGSTGGIQGEGQPAPVGDPRVVLARRLRPDGTWSAPFP